MKKTMIWMLGVAAAMAANLAFADATAFDVTGDVRAQAGTAAARVVRKGDQLRAGDTVSTGLASSAVLRFDDGQIAALGPKSRMQITAYDYDAQAKTGNVVLNLLNGGMRAITGLIGKLNPQRVTYRASNYTIGIRGTDVIIATVEGEVAVSVLEGEISFTFGTQTITVRAGEGVNARTDKAFQASAVASIVEQLQATARGRELLEYIRGVEGLAGAVSQAAGGGLGKGDEGQPNVVGSGVTPGPSAPGSSGGGGTASQR